MKDYEDRPKNEEKHMGVYTEMLTALEKELNKTLELVHISGKRGCGVPVLIPLECTRLYIQLMDPKIREIANVKDNPYLFVRPNTRGKFLYVPHSAK